MATLPVYATTESVARAPDVAETAYAHAQIFDAIASGARLIDDQTHRRFYPETGTRFFDWPDPPRYGRSWVLWLDANEMISVTSVVVGGTTLTSGSYFLRRSDEREEPPYDQLQIDLDSSSSFAGGSGGPQKAIAVTGVYGHSANTKPAGTITTAINSASTTTLDVTDAGLVGVGDLLLAGTERMIVTGRAMIDTGQNLGGAGLTAAPNDTLAAVTGVTPGEVLLIDAERMLVVDVAGSNAVVKRAWDGTVLAAHTAGVNVYAARRLTVERGAVGTTAASSHAQGVALSKHVPPAPVAALNRAEAINTLLQERAGYARTSGSGENERETSARGLADLRKQVARMARLRTGAV